MGAVKSTYHRYSSLHVVGESTFFFYEVVENIGDIPIEAVEKFLHYLINETLSGLYGHPVHAIHPEAVNIAIQQRQLKNDIPPLARMDMYKEPNAKLNVGANKVDLKDAQDTSVPVNTCADVLAHLKTSPAGVAATNAANEEAETAYASMVADLKVVGGARDYPNTAARDQKSELFLCKAWDNKTEFLTFIRMMLRAVAFASNEYLQLHTASFRSSQSTNEIRTGKSAAATAKEGGGEKPLQNVEDFDRKIAEQSLNPVSRGSLTAGLTLRDDLEEGNLINATNSFWEYCKDFTVRSWVPHLLQRSTDDLSGIVPDVLVEVALATVKAYTKGQLAQEGLIDSERNNIPRDLYSAIGTAAMWFAIARLLQKPNTPFTIAIVSYTTRKWY
jgi:hypothetical protein